MKVDNIFSEYESVAKGNFIKDYCLHEKSKERDVTADAIYNQLKGSNDISYWKGAIKESALERLIFPHHEAHTELPVVPREGQSYWEVIKKYPSFFSKEATYGKCTNKVKRLSNSDMFNNFNGNIDFIFYSDDAEIAHEGLQHYGQKYINNHDLIYMGSGFHRLIAYGLWLKKQESFKPINAYYCKKRETTV